MKGFEIVVNGVILRPVSNIIGLPLVLSGTAEMMSGIGISLKEYSKIALAFERIMNSKGVGKIKKIYKIIRGKD